MICSGLYTALITPFDREGELDRAGFRTLIRRQREAHVEGIVVLGTTGESVTLTDEEKEEMLTIAVEEKGEMSLVVGCGTPSTSETIENIEMAFRQGANGALVITPFYNKPSPEGLYQHFAEISRHAPLPFLLYNNPGRTGVHLDIDTLLKLSRLPSICGLKESSSNMLHILDLFSIVKKEAPHFAILCGDDHLLHPMFLLGAEGAISHTANLYPRKLRACVEASLSRRWEEAQSGHRTFYPLFKALALESNPIPLKAALAHLGLPAGLPRLPLTPLSSRHLSHLIHLLNELRDDVPSTCTCVAHGQA